jgi:hypothetical protein
VTRQSSCHEGPLRSLLDCSISYVGGRDGHEEEEMADVDQKASAGNRGSYDGWFAH